VEDEIIKELGNITNLYIFPVTARVVVIKLGLIMKKEQFAKFNDWLMSKGFNDIKIDSNNEISWLLTMLGCNIARISKRHIVRYQHIKDKKVFYVVYTMDDVVTLEGIIYFEQSQ
jgi:hypothetical protein